MKKSFETQIGQVSNGVVVKVGCQLFVGQPDDLDMLCGYYGGEIPEEFKKEFSEDTAFSQGDCPMADCGKDIMDEGGLKCPEFVEQSGMKIITAINGFILIKEDGSAWVAKTSTELVKLMGFKK